MEQIFDLLGDPIPENFGRRGRPAHIPTQENRNKVRLLLAFGWTDPRIAQALRITTPTLRKHYFRELRHREEARPALEASALMMVYKSAAEGNASAQKELLRLIDRLNMTAAEQAINDRQQGDERAARLGKKEAAALAAQSAGEGSDWGDDLLGPRRGQPTVN
jgi:hypothetical protein